MGSCYFTDGTPSSNLNKYIQLDLQRDKRQDWSISKLLMVGARKSGKSTLFHQLRVAY